MNSCQRTVGVVGGQLCSSNPHEMPITLNHRLLTSLVHRYEYNIGCDNTCTLPPENLGQFWC